MSNSTENLSTSVNAPSDDEITRYLLGEMSPDQETKFEIAFFADAALFAQVTQKQAELTDQYTRQQLSAAEKLQFEKKLIVTPAQQEQLAFAQALRQALNEQSVNIADSNDQAAGWLAWLQRPIALPVWSLATAAALFVFGVSSSVWLWRAQQGTQHEIATLRNEQSAAKTRERALQEQLAALTKPSPANELPSHSPAPNLSPQPPPPRTDNLIALNLLAMQSDRAGTIDKLPRAELHGTTQRLQLALQLDFAPQPQSLTASLQSADQKIQLPRQRIPFRCNGRCVATYTTRTLALTPGTYKITVQAKDSDGLTPVTLTYEFELIPAQRIP